MTDTTSSTVTGSQLGLAAITATMAVVAYVADLSPELSALILTALTAWFLVAAAVWRRYLVSRGRVVEETPDGKTVIAGPANEIRTGAVVRTNLGTMPAASEAPRHAAE